MRVKRINFGHNAKEAIENFMTVVPHAVEPHELLAVAKQRMAQHHVRHMPVRLGGKVVGLLSERDMELAEKMALDRPTPAAVELVMTPDPYCVGPKESVVSVATEMAERRIGSALVVDQVGHLLGIFTGTDALRALARLVETRA